MEAVITNSYYCNGTPDVNDACLIAMEAGIYMINNYRHASSDANYACFTRSRTFGRRRLGAGIWAPAFGRTAVWTLDVWAPAVMRKEIGFYRHYHYFINPV